MNYQLVNREPLITIVDDDRGSRESLAAVAEAAGYRTECFSTGESFLEDGDLTQTGCLVVDYQLPGLSGVDILERLNLQRTKPPFVLVSAFADVTVAVKVMELGALTLLEKPYSQDAMLDVITRAVKIDVTCRKEQQKSEEALALVKKLTSKEMDVLQYMLRGMSNGSVAGILKIGLRTVERRRHEIFKKMKVDSEVEVAELVKCYGLELMSSPERHPLV